MPPGTFATDRERFNTFEMRLSWPLPHSLRFVVGRLAGNVSGMFLNPGPAARCKAFQAFTKRKAVLLSFYFFHRRIVGAGMLEPLARWFARCFPSEISQGAQHCSGAFSNCICRIRGQQAVAHSWKAGKPEGK
jgi:hypothetical protein